jgi:hypothetical protein
MQKNFGGLKFHDYHVLMQQKMSLALKGVNSKTSNGHHVNSEGIHKALP